MLVDLIIRNYKSLRDVHLRDLPPFSVMVGANASGKSNLVDALDFISLVSRSGLAPAVSAKGGYENICFRRARRSKASIEFQVTVCIPASRLRARRRAEAPLRFEYGFGFRAETRRIAAEYKVTHERLAVGRVDAVGVGLEIVREGGREPRVQLSDEAERDFGLPELDFLRDFIARAPVSEDDLLWAGRLGGILPFRQLFGFLGGCRVYQISPEMARKAGTPERSPELGRHGENLPAAVDYLKRNEVEAFEELVSHLNHAVSTMETLDTDYVETKELGLFFKERGVGRRWYAQDVSDGTLKTVSMFLPLLDPRVTIVAIEEPENNLHPWILRHFMEACKAQGGGKQIFVTTHSPVAVDEVPIESLFIVRRRAGRTEIQRLDALFPEAAQVVREELFGLGEYWDSGAISGVPEADVDVE
jgi:predicted ATPase